MKYNDSTFIKKAGGGLFGLLVLLAIIIAVYVITGSLRARLDLTEEKIYTLSQGSKSIVGKLDSEITLKLFFNSSSPEIPVILKSYARNVEDLLKEYQKASHGKIILEKYDPTPDSDAEEAAQQCGIPGQQLAAMMPPIYFGLVAVAGNTETSIPVLDPRAESLLEYNITKLIYRVINPEKPTIGVLSPLPVLGEENPMQFGQQPQQRRAEPWAIFKELKDDYNIKRIRPDSSKIDDDVDVLVVIHPSNIEDSQMFAIDQFIMRGGRVLAMVDPMCLADMNQNNPMGAMPGTSDLSSLFKAWGVTYNPGQVLADLRASSKLQGPNNTVDDNPIWLSLDKSTMNADDIATSQLETMMLPLSGAFDYTAASNLTVTPLITSSPNSSLISSMSARFGAQAIRREFKASNMRQSMAIRLNGTFKTAFPDGKPAPASETDKDKKPAAPVPGLKEGKSTVVLVADVDMLMDQFCVQELNFFGYKGSQPINNNIAFILNVIEQIAGSSDLVSIRSRGKFNRPFTYVQDIERKARDQWQAKESSLMEKLTQAQQQLNEMQMRKDKNQRTILSKEQKDAIELFQKDEQQIKKELKQVRKNLRSDIEQLGIKVKTANIVLMPLLVALAGVAYGLYRKSK